MTAEKLEETLRLHKFRKPFEPFTLELVDGRSILIDDGAALGFGAGIVFFMSLEYGLMDVKYDEVADVHLATADPNVEKLEETLRSFKYREPFKPFVVELTEGDPLFVDNPSAFGFYEGAIGFLTPTYDFVMVEYYKVRDVHLAPAEAAT